MTGPSPSQDGQVPAAHYFASDNASGVHPEVLGAIAAANAGHVVGYGADAVTQLVEDIFRLHFGEHARVALVTTGTAANVIGLRAVTDSYQAVLCADSSHLYRDECGAPEHFLGCKVIPLATTDAMVSVETVAPALADNDMVHRAQPRVLSISQCTELGTVYPLEQVRALADLCHRHGLLLHADGARLANAAAALGCSLGEASTDVGVDLLSFGGTKNGALAAEAVVVLRDGIADALPYYRKQGMQLVSKMRFVAAQFVALLSGDLWRRNAEHANAMAALLAREVAAVPGIDRTVPQQTNVVFARLPAQVTARVQREIPFSVWDPTTGLVRWMTSFDTTEDDVHRFVSLLATAMSQQSRPQERS